VKIKIEDPTPQRPLSIEEKIRLIVMEMQSAREYAEDSTHLSEAMVLAEQQLLELITH